MRPGFRPWLTLGFYPARSAILTDCSTSASGSASNLAMQADAPLPFVIHGLGTVMIAIPTGVIRARSSFRQWWNFFLLLLVIISSFLIPFQVAFQHVALERSSNLTYLIDLYFMIDIGLNFYTTYRKNGVEIRDQSQIARHYLHTFFTIDLIASFPFDVLFLLVPSANVAGISLILIARSLRLLRIITLFRIFRDWESQSWANSGLLRIIKYFTTIILLIHWVACVWFLAAFVQDFPAESWVADLGLETAAPIHQYLYALYWAVTTMTTVGYGDITPNRLVEYVLAIAVMLLGASMYAFIIGNIASLFSNLDAAKAEHKNRAESITTFLRYRQVDAPLIERVSDYYQYLWSRHRGMHSEDLFNDLPPALRLELMRQITIHLLDQVPLFRYSPPSLQSELLQALKLHTYTPKTQIASEGEIGETIFFIGQGRVRVTSAENPDFSCVLESGEYFGDLSLLLGERRTGTVTTLEYCEIFTLSKDDFTLIRQRYPELRDVLKTVSSQKTEKATEILLAGITL